MEDTKTATFTLPGFVLTILAGAVAAGAVGYAYYFVANVLNFDLIILVAVIVGAAVGGVMGMAARLGRLRSSLVLILAGLIFGLAGYGARYFYEFNELVGAYVEEMTPPGGSSVETRAEFLEFMAEEYPPGGYVGYLRYVAEAGFTVTDDLFTDEGSGTLTQGPLVWITLVGEAVLASVAAAGVARSIAIGPLSR